MKHHRQSFFAGGRNKATARTTSTTLCCMLLFVAFLKQGVVRTGAAFASTSRGISSNRLVHHLPSQRFHSLATSSVSLHERINGDDPGRNNNKNNQGSSTSSSNQEQKVPETGWKHNPPSASSNFWNGPNQEALSRRRGQRNGSSTTSSSSSSSSSEPRTGWLHNTQSSSPSRQTQQTAQTTKKKGVGNMARRRLELAKLQQERNHRLISTPALHAAGEDHLVAVTEHAISVPLRYNNKNKIAQQSQQRIDVYFSIIEKVESEGHRLFLQNELSSSLSSRQRADRYVEYANLQTADDAVLYLQGGPGFGAPTPVAGLAASVAGSWAGAALHKHGYKRVVLMDQRGTGHSTPVTKQTLEQQFPDLFLLDTTDDIASNSRDLDDLASHDDYDRVHAAVQQVTDYLVQFRADHIVLDAEYIREALMVVNLDEEVEDDNNDDENGNSPKIRPWGCSIGQSYGGFCSMTYMSLVAHPPRIMLMTGGIAPMCSDLFANYRSLWDRCRERSLRYYEQYPSDVPLVHAIVKKLLEAPAPLPSGGRLTARRFLSLGMALGGSPSAFASMHSLLSLAFVGGVAAAASAAERPADLTFTRAFLKRIDSEQSFDDHPIYFWMHETIYADGPNNNVPTNWAAHRAYESKVKEAPDAFDYRRTCQSENEPTLFFGEHVFPWMPEDFAELSGIGLRAVANSLATRTDWGPLYDVQHMQMVHVAGRTRSAAAVYHEDMYVDFDACMKVAAREGPLSRCKLYVTNEYQHSGLRDSGAAIFSKLHGMAKGGTQTPS